MTSITSRQIGLVMSEVCSSFHWAQSLLWGMRSPSFVIIAIAVIWPLMTALASRSQHSPVESSLARWHHLALAVDRVCH